MKPLRLSEDAIMNSRRLILIGIPIVAALIAAALIFSQGSSSTPSPTNLVDVTEVVAELQGIPETKGVLGYPDAPITIVEYGDLRCPVCKEFDLQTMPDVITQLVQNHKVPTLKQGASHEEAAPFPL